MTRNRRLALLLAVLALLTACSREGFAESLSRETQPSSSQAESKPERVGAIYELETQTAEGIEGSYSIPVSGSEEQEKAVKRIGRSIRGAVSQLPDYLAGEGTAPALTLGCEVTANNGNYFSVSFSLSAKSGEEEKQFGWGMILDAATGSDVMLEQLIEPEALSILLLDGPSVELIGVDEATAQKQRDYLAEQGSAALCERLLRSDPGNPQTLLDASYYLSDARIVSVFAAPSEVGGVIRAAIRI